MNKEQSIFLIGPMGSGKSAVGRRLAKNLGREFCDSDSVIEERTGVDIAFIFEKEGESGFRDREREVIDELTGKSGIVLATGGGAILLPENRARIAERGTVIYLCTSVSEQLQRTRQGKERPLLNVDDKRATLEALMQMREPLYLETGHFTVTTDGRSVTAVTTDIMNFINESPA
jgi:shikimate kinase